jgi:RNase H-fold protein (predicted Holliday junction resolvase)
MFNNKRRPKSVLAIDRWSKYVWLAYQLVGQTVTFPIWYLINDQMIFFNIWDIIQKHNVSSIVVWRPARQEDIQEKISKFMSNLDFIIWNREITLEKVEEDYSSVQFWDIISNSAKELSIAQDAAFKKNQAVDTISAMLILDRWNAKQNGL